jgi:hypothetical protein
LNTFTLNSTFDNINYNVNTSTISFSARNAGSYSANVVSFNNSNYEFVSAQLSVTIAPFKLNTSWSNLNTTYNGLSQSAKLTMTGFLSNDELEINSSSYTDYMLINRDSTAISITSGSGKVEFDFSAIDADTYSIQLDDKIGGNYTFDTTSRNFIINQKRLTGEWSNNAFIYNGSNRSSGLTFSEIASRDIEKFNISSFSFDHNVNDVILNKQASSFTINFIERDAGNYKTNVIAFNEQSLNKNYFLTRIDGSFNIAPLSLEVQWNNIQFEYNSQKHMVQAQVTNLIDPDDIINITYTGNEATNVGSYTASIQIDNPNYAVSSRSEERRVGKECPM